MPGLPITTIAVLAGAPRLRLLHYAGWKSSPAANEAQVPYRVNEIRGDFQQFRSGQLRTQRQQ